MAVFPEHVQTGAAGAALANAASAGAGGKFTTNFFWKAGEKRYVQFVSDYDGIPTIPFHVVNAGKTKTGKTMMKNFVDPRYWQNDPTADNALVEAGWEPKPKRVAVVLEVVPVMGKNQSGRSVPVGWEPATRSFNRKSGEEVTVPNVGVVVNTQTLFGHVDTYFEDNGTINDAVFSIKRNGGDQNTTYSVQPQKGTPVELTDDLRNEIDLAEYLSGLADSAGIRELVASLPDDWEYDYSKRGNTKSAPVANTDDEDEPDVEEGDTEAEFNKLKASLQ